MCKTPCENNTSEKESRLRQKIVSLQSELQKLKTAQKARGKYRDYFNQASDGLVLIDKETAKIVDFNDHAYKCLGYTREEFKRLKMQELGLLESPEQRKKHLEHVHHKKGTTVFVTRHRQKNGKVRDILTRSKPVAFNGKTYFLSTWTDVTRQRDLRRNLQQSDKDLADTLSALKNLLQQTELDQKAIEAKIFSNLEHLILPHLKKLTSILHRPEQQQHLQQIKSKLNRLAEKTLGTPTVEGFDFTEKEKQVAMFIKHNRTSKEIARSMNISVSTVDFHRKNIRKKLALNKSGMNLKKYLSDHNG